MQNLKLKDRLLNPKSETLNSKQIQNPKSKYETVEKPIFSTLSISKTCMRSKRSFTLVELLIASSIFVVVMLTISTAFQSGIFGFRNIEESIDVYQNARQILERMNLDLRNCFAYSDSDSKFIGNKDNVSFLTLVNTFSKDALVQDYSLVLYKLEGNKLMRLCKKNKESLNDKSQIQSEEMASIIEKIDFSYGYVGSIDQPLKFKDLWAVDVPEEQGALPVAIKVVLTLENKVKQDFQRTIFLPLTKAQ